MLPRVIGIPGVALALLILSGCRGVGSPNHNIPPAERLMHPGPGVTGPGPGVQFVPPIVSEPQATTESGTAQIFFVGPETMQVQWDAGGLGQFDSISLVAPGRQNFTQGGVYRLKLTHITGREGIELYPTLELGYTTPRSQAFLSHNAIPVQFTEEDLNQALSNNFVTKVIYLPDPAFQDLALAGVETLVSTRLDPGVDPVVEADRRGAILAIVRLGNVDLEMPGGLPGESGDEQIIQASHISGYSKLGLLGPGSGPGINPVPFRPTPTAPPFVAGITAPPYGMPVTGTPIGLPGPPHIPLGFPAGLQSHKMVNHTHSHLPDPSRNVRMDVKHTPGISYPKPATNVKIKETMVHPMPQFRQPLYNKFQQVP